MGFIEMLFLALGMSMDAFAVSVCKGLSMKKATLKAGLTCGAWFGSFQTIMPLAGFFLASVFAAQIEAFDHWVAFGLLGIIGANMLKEAFSGCDECGNEDADLSFKTMLLMAVATSIDAMAAGIAIAMEANKEPVNVYVVVALIGVVTFCMSAVGVKIGNVFGSRFEKKAQIAGGVILIGLGIKILLEHLEVLP